MESSNSAQYATAQQGSAFFVIRGAGYMHITGEDRISFLQRQTTNNLQQLEPGRGLATVLTSPTARILDMLYTFLVGETLHAVPLPGQASKTVRFLKSRIFFMDKVAIEDTSPEMVQAHLLGPQAGDLLARVGLPQPAEGEVAPIHLDTTAQGFLFQPGKAYGPGYRLLLPEPAWQGTLNLFQSAGAVELDPERYEVLRVEAGLPAAGAELSEDYTPLEAGLEELISSSKGCYTGQEIIARQITYDKVTQHLCGLILKQPAQPGDKVWADGKAVGMVTSAVQSPRFGPIALAILKRPAHQPGTTVQVGGKPETAFPAETTRLPFDGARANG